MWKVTPKTSHQASKVNSTSHSKVGFKTAKSSAARAISIVDVEHNRCVSIGVPVPIISTGPVQSFSS